MLSRSRKVLVPIAGGAEGVFYGYYDDDTGEAKIVLTLGSDTVEEFGHPEKLTVTIEPGDLLN